MHHVLAFFVLAFLMFTMFLVGILAISLYFLPSVIAFVRHTRYRWWVVAVNVLFGFSLVGWFICAVAACVDEAV